MRIEIPLSEAQQFLSTQYKFNIDLKNIGENKIKATYIDSIVLIIKEVKEDVVLFRYEVDWLTSTITNMAHFFLEKRLDKSPIEWDSKSEEIKINLNKITELDTFLKFISVSEIHFKNDAIVLEMCVRGKA